MCSDYWTEKVPGCPQRHTKARRSTPQGASLIHDSACLQEQPQEFKDRTTLAIGCFHLILTLFFSLARCFENSGFVLSPALHPFHFECTIPPCYFFPNSLLCHSAHVIHHHILSLLIFPHKLTLPPLQFPLLFLIFLCNTICLPFALTIKISPFSVIIRLRQLGRAPCVEICRSTVCGGCVCTDRHWVNAIKGWCSTAKWQRDRQDEEARR